ncbi:facilitated trehalose transporter Tret1 isoform X2 [Diachasmimorpha longicaudata]|uniref:facilitated trehalose transporter Tret1 isoform X2 n=1 Tax=Diachasmimorpha longicaudata TaxID=58733 RepID=UPI0030B8D479
MEDVNYNVAGSSEENTSESTPLLADPTMTESHMGISQQTLVSRGGDTSARKLPQYIAGLAATLGALAAGMVLGWTSPAGENGVLLAKEYNINIDKEDFSWIGSIFNLGAATICVPIGMLTDIIGRKKSMLVLVVPFTIGWALIIWSTSVGMFEAGRYILGVSGGAFCVTAPMYTGEIAENSIRGSLGSYFQLMLVIGILLSYVLGSFVTMFTLSLIAAIIPLVFVVIFFFMPETPTYHLKKGNVEAARQSYRWLRGPDYNIEGELENQRAALAEVERNQTSFLTAIRSKAAIRGLIIAFGLMFFQQLSGVNAIIFYSGSIFDKAGGGAMSSSTATIVVGVMQVVAVFISTLVVDRLGRRLLLLASIISMSISALVMGVYYHLKDSGNPVADDIGWLPLLAVCVFIVMFSLGFGPIPWMMMGEIFAPQVKGIAGSSACFFNWLMAFIVTRFYTPVQDALGSDWTFWIFAIICAVGVAFVLLIVPETKGKSLEEIQVELGGRRPTVARSNYSNKV